MQVTDMDSRIDALSRMVDRLLEERSDDGGAGAVTDGASVKHEIPLNAVWAKKRRLVGEWDGSADANQSDGGAVVRLSAGPPRVKMEAGDAVNGEQSAAGLNDGGGAQKDPAAVRVKAELSGEGPVYQFSAGESGGTTDAGVGDGMIIGGGALCRDSSFLRDLDNMSIGSVGSMLGGSGSLGPLELIDVTSSDNGGDGARAGDTNTAVDAMNESIFDIDFDAEITSMSGSTHGERQHQPSASDATAAIEPGSPGRSAALPTPTPAVGAASTPATAAAATNSAAVAVTPTLSRGAPPEIAMPLASAALGAFMVHYATAKAAKEPANAVAAVAMDTSRHALERTASLR